MNTSKFTLPNGSTLSYMEYGNPRGKAVLVLHGLAGSIAGPDLAQQLSGLPLRMIYLARPGYGESGYFEMNCVADWARQLEPFLDALQLSSFDVVGISAGGPYAYSFAALYPQRVGTVYINGGVTAVYNPKILALYGAENEAAYKQLQAATRAQAGQAVYQAYLPLFTPEMKASMDYQDSFGGDLLNIGQESVLQMSSWGFGVEDISRPVVLLHGTADDVVPYAAAQATADLIPHSRLVSLEGEGHVSSTSMAELVRLLIQ